MVCGPAETGKVRVTREQIDAASHANSTAAMPEVLGWVRASIQKRTSPADQGTPCAHVGCHGGIAQVCTIMKGFQFTVSPTCYLHGLQVEQYVCSRISRNPSARLSGAKYLGEFTAEQSIAGFTKGVLHT